MSDFEILVSVFVALFGWWFTLWREREKRWIDSEISRINSQIECLWGPLFAASVRNQGAWESLEDRWKIQFNRSLSSEGNKYLDNENKRDIWILYNKNVFQPINQTIIEVISQNTHLFENRKNAIIPSEITWVIKHIESWRAITSNWESEKFDARKAQWFELEATNAWNDKFIKCCKKNLRRCVKRKADLLERRTNWRFISINPSKIGW